MRSVFLVAFALLGLAACREEKASLPQAVAVTDEALGYYCQMSMSEHAGPKAQVHLANTPAPLFFSQVRDAIAFQRMPEQQGEILAVYVSDMSRAPGWQDPGANNWILLDAAYLVVGSDAVGGMGAAEIVPFSIREDALAFATERGGTVLAIREIPDDAVLSPVEVAASDDRDGDIARRLRALQPNGGN